MFRFINIIQGIEMVNSKVRDFVQDLPSMKNEWEEFLNRYKEEKKEIIFWGVGSALEWYDKLFKKYNLGGVRFVVDGSDKKIGSQILGLQIVSSSVLKNMKDIYLIITSPAHEIEIRSAASQYIGEDSIFCFDPTIDVMWNNDIELYKKYIKENASEICRIYESLCDEKSKKTLQNTLINWVTYKCNVMKETALKDTYFPTFIKDNLTEQEVFVDCGAYDGDSIIAFENVVKKYKKIYAFEPDSQNYVELLKHKGNGNIEIFKKGVSDKKDKLFFKNSSCTGVDEGAHIVQTQDESTESIEVVALDEVINDEVTLIKMDIEGSELKALKGAQKLIKSCKPKLAICVYHQSFDLIEIFNFINNLSLNYHFYLRNTWECGGTDVVLFAI